MTSEICVHCSSETFYYCVKCTKAVCNRPTCSNSVAPDNPNYSEDHPKKVSECKHCSSDEVQTPVNVKTTRHKQQRISSFFTTSQPRYV